MRMFSIAIDGPSGAGKSTIAKSLAQKLGFVYLDTGAIYRTIAFYFTERNVSHEDPAGVEEQIGGASITIGFPGDGKQHMILNGRDITDKIRTPEISMSASLFSALPVVRTKLLGLQRNVAEKENVIMDGRDIGTVVLPNADVKVFLTASAAVRAKRRFKELLEKGETVTYQEVLEDMERRDCQDSTRKTAPLRCAPDAVCVDSSELGIEETAEAILRIVKEKLPVRAE